MSGISLSPCLDKAIGSNEENLLQLNEYTAVLLDMDGVLYRGQMPLPGVNELLAGKTLVRLARILNVFVDGCGQLGVCLGRHPDSPPHEIVGRIAL